MNQKTEIQVYDAVNVPVLLKVNMLATYICTLPLHVSVNNAVQIVQGFYNATL